MRLFTILLSAAAGAAIATYFTVGGGKRRIDNAYNGYEDAVTRTADKLKKGIDMAADKIHLGKSSIEAQTFENSHS